MIELHGLTKRFGDKLAVAGMDLTVPAGEVFALLGPNGAGKTTTLKILAGLVRPTSGTAAVAGHDVVASALAAKSAMSYVPDAPYLYDKLTGREFMRLVADLYGIPRLEREARSSELARLFELEGFLDELCETYSHGMKQRVVFAAALLHEPKVLVLDEPTVGLDPKSARTLKTTLRRMARERGAAILMSTHTLAIAEEAADRIGIMHLGRLIAAGTLAELRAGYAAGLSLEDLFLQLTDGNAAAE